MLKCYKNGKIPTLAAINKMSFPNKPKELDLNQLEERLIALRIPFMQIRELPRGGQLSIRGNVVNVPCEIAPTVHSLPRNLINLKLLLYSLRKKSVTRSVIS